MPRTGRPSKHPSQRKVGFVKFRIEPAEKEAFQQAADLGGIPLSAWVRERLRRAAISELEQVGVRVPFFADLYAGE